MNTLSLESTDDLWSCNCILLVLLSLQSKSSERTKMSMRFLTSGVN